MMYRKIGFAELAISVLESLRKNTPYDVYDAVPDDAESPLLFVEVIGKRDSSSKTTWKETFTVNIHCIAEPSNARTQIYQMIQHAEEAMTAPLSMPKGVECLLQAETGVQSLQLDETNEWHAVISYDIMTSYGLKIK